MTLDEREHVAEVARANWPGRQFINVSSCNVQDSLRLLNHCQQTKEHLKVNLLRNPLNVPPAGVPKTSARHLCKSVCYQIGSPQISGRHSPAPLQSLPAGLQSNSML